jgi:hypothetical protein
MHFKTIARSPEAETLDESRTFVQSVRTVDESVNLVERLQRLSTKAGKYKNWEIFVRPVPFGIPKYSHFHLKG